MSGRQGNSKSPLIIRGKRCDFRSLFVLHDESGIRERFRTGSIRPDRSTLSWTKRNHSFDPCKTPDGLRATIDAALKEKS